MSDKKVIRKLQEKLGWPQKHTKLRKFLLQMYFFFIQLTHTTATYFMFPKTKKRQTRYSKSNGSHFCLVFTSFLQSVFWCNSGNCRQTWPIRRRKSYGVVEWVWTPPPWARSGCWFRCTPNSHHN